MSGGYGKNPDLRAAAYGAIHALVDAACVLAVSRTGASAAVQALTSFWVVFGYDALAFATQAPFGVLVDRLRVPRAAVYAGIGLTTASLLLTRQSAIATMLAAGVGNALFHLGAGASVLRSSGGRATPAGLFVAPGALGLGLGLWMGRTGIGPAWPFVALLMLALPLVDLLDSSESGAEQSAAAHLGPGPTRAITAFALSLLLVSVTIRAFVGFGACRECQKGVLLAAGLPLAACCGKMVGGFVADRLGWIRSSVAALLVSAPFIAFNGGNLILALPGVLLFQMTMPVTLVAVWRLMPQRPATAFGLPCLALIIGSIPTFFPAGRQLFGPVTFMALVVISAAAIAIALLMIGVQSGGHPRAVIGTVAPSGQSGVQMSGEPATWSAR